MDKEKLIDAALEITGDSRDGVMRYDIEGDEFVLLVGRGIKGNPKFRWSIAELEAMQSEPKEPGAPTVTAKPEPMDIDATGAAERLADEAGLDLAMIEGTGVDGRVLKGDVERALEGDGE